MSLNPLKIASDGYLKRTTKAVLVIAVAGYLNFQGTPPILPIPEADGSGGQFVGGGKREKYSFEEQERDRLVEKIRREDGVLIEILKNVAKWQ